MSAPPDAGSRDSRAGSSARDRSRARSAGSPSGSAALRVGWRQPVDEVVVRQLAATVRAMHPSAVVQSYIPQWWDGTALVPALLVVVEGRRARAVTGPDGGVVLLPRASWLARRRLQRARGSAGGAPATVDRPHVAVTPGGLPRTPLLYEAGGKRPRPVRSGRPGPRPPVRIGEAVDYRACSNVGCGAIIALPATGPDPVCPRCGRR